MSSELSDPESGYTPYEGPNLSILPQSSIMDVEQLDIEEVFIMFVL